MLLRFLYGCGLLVCFDLEVWFVLIVLMISVWYCFCWYFDGLMGLIGLVVGICELDVVDCCFAIGL